MNRLEGKVAVITGGNSGIGLATAKRLQREAALLSPFRMPDRVDGGLRQV